MPRSAQRLTAVDSSFLVQEDETAHMHIAALWTFDGPPPDDEEFRWAIRRRLDRLPQFRRRLARVPFGQGTAWIDDPGFDPWYHVSHWAVPAPGEERQANALIARLLSQPLDRTRPLWEIFLVSHLEDGFMVILKVHHALLDGVSLVDVANVLFDAAPQPPEGEPAPPWAPAPEPTDAELLFRVLWEQATGSAAAVRRAATVARDPHRVVAATRFAASALTRALWARLRPAPSAYLRADPCPHRRLASVACDLDDLRRVGRRSGATVNDVALAAIGQALGAYMRRLGFPTRDVMLRALIPRSIRSEAERGALGNRIAGMIAPLPLEPMGPDAGVARMHETMVRLKRSAEGDGVELLGRIGGYVPQPLVVRAVRMAVAQRPTNVVVTNVVAPRSVQYLLGRPMRRFRIVPTLPGRHALSIGIASYHGRVELTLLAHYDAIQLELLERCLSHALRETVAATREGHGLSRTGRGPRCPEPPLATR